MQFLSSFWVVVVVLCFVLWFVSVSHRAIGAKQGKQSAMGFMSMMTMMMMGFLPID